MPTWSARRQSIEITMRLGPRGGWVATRGFPHRPALSVSKASSTSSPAQVERSISGWSHQWSSSLTATVCSKIAASSRSTRNRTASVGSFTAIAKRSVARSGTVTGSTTAPARAGLVSYPRLTLSSAKKMGSKRSGISRSVQAPNTTHNTIAKGNERERHMVWRKVYSPSKNVGDRPAAGVGRIAVRHRFEDGADTKRGNVLRGAASYEL